MPSLHFSYFPFGWCKATAARPCLSRSVVVDVCSSSNTAFVRGVNVIQTIYLIAVYYGFQKILYCMLYILNEALPAVLSLRCTQKFKVTMPLPVCSGAHRLVIKTQVENRPQDSRPSHMGPQGVPIPSCVFTHGYTKIGRLLLGFIRNSSSRN